ncbi:MAG: hypothetical protein NC394_10265 [Bacteroides sp.]|nr:hypothetical protein [Bacteroides sp.]
MSKKAEKFSDAVGLLDEDIIKEADEKRESAAIKKNNKGKIWVPVVSAAACAGIICGALFTGNGDGTPGLVPVLMETLAEAKYPEAVQYPDDSLPNAYSEEWFAEVYDPWLEQREERAQAAMALDSESLKDFYRLTCEEFLDSGAGTNAVYSPVNVYMALSMLAEVTEGNSRAQILELAGADSIEALRRQAANLWSACYRSDGAVTSVLANSLWINSGADFNGETVDRLANDYFASVYRGDFASSDTVNALKEWLNKQTDGLLEEAVNSLEISPETVLTLCSAICFKAPWDSEFDPAENDVKVFHGANGDVEAEFMNKTESFGTYYKGECFGAVRLGFKSDGDMWLFLPDEGRTVADILKSGEYLELLSGASQKGQQAIINLSVPKFDVSTDIDLKDKLKALGVKDVFDPRKADFSPLSDTEGLYISQVRHASRVVTDEEGCTAAAFTVLALAGGTLAPDDEIDFVVDRPFLFVINGPQPLFAGRVEDIG